MDGGGDSSSSEAKSTKRKTAEEEEESTELVPLELLQGHEHEDTIRVVFRFYDTMESGLEPMRLTKLTPECSNPFWPVCRRHDGCDMLQIFSLKLNLPPASFLFKKKRLDLAGAAAASGRILHIYGFVAVRDQMDSLRNYVFKRGRDEPLVVVQQQDEEEDAFVLYPSGPKRGLLFDRYVLLEYHLKMKSSGGGRDVPLVRGEAILDAVTQQQQQQQLYGPPVEGARVHGPVTSRIHGRHGATLDVSRAFFPSALEATVQVRILKLNAAAAAGMDLSVTACFLDTPGEVKLFRGMVDGPCELPRLN